MPNLWGEQTPDELLIAKLKRERDGYKALSQGFRRILFAKRLGWVTEPESAKKLIAKGLKLLNQKPPRPKKDPTAEKMLKALRTRGAK